MKKFILLASLVMSSILMAESYPADGPDSYKETHKWSTYNDGDGLAQRKGFRLGIGVGAGSLELDNGGMGGLDDFSEFGFATSFEIGYASSNQISINYLNNVSWVSGESYLADGDHVGGFTGVTVNYYMEDAQDTGFVVAGIGLTTFRDYDDFSNVDTGTGYLIGAGYAFGKVELEADFIFGKNDAFQDDSDFRAFQVTVSYLFY